MLDKGDKDKNGKMSLGEFKQMSMSDQEPAPSSSASSLTVTTVVLGLAVTMWLFGWWVVRLSMYNVYMSRYTCYRPVLCRDRLFVSVSLVFISGRLPFCSLYSWDNGYNNRYRFAVIVSLTATLTDTWGWKWQESFFVIFKNSKHIRNKINVLKI